MMKIIQIAYTDEDSLTALTDDGRIFTGYWRGCKFHWASEITPDENKLTHLSLEISYKDENQNI